ncbi:MAG: flagellar biosynthetic protein FliR [Desulfobacteraceae bacterium]|nr:MAG: flagellar biosynthetic protein FliR [Desulfobacteraceae bacterium]
MELLSFNEDQLKAFFLVLIRISVFISMFPIFSANVIPAPVKALFSLLLSMVLFPLVGVDTDLFPESIVSFLLLIVSELIVGLVLGLAVQLFFSGVQLAGQMIGFQMGFAIINVMDPQGGNQISIIDQIGYWVVLVVFLALDGHHTMIWAIKESFHLVDIGTISLKRDFIAYFIHLSSGLFVLSVKVGSPAVAALLLTSAAFGISAKFAPQMNILIAAFPVKIVIGLIFFGLSLEIIAGATETYLGSLRLLFRTLLTWLGG